MSVLKLVLGVRRFFATMVVVFLFTMYRLAPHVR